LSGEDHKHVRYILGIEALHELGNLPELLVSGEPGAE
jgi:hypothetical protein